MTIRYGDKSLIVTLETSHQLCFQDTMYCSVHARTLTGPVSFGECEMSHPDFDQSSGTFTCSQSGLYRGVSRHEILLQKDIGPLGYSDTGYINTL